MKIILKAIFFVFCSSSAIAQNDLSLSISIPQNSGLAFVNYENFEISNNKLYVIDRIFTLVIDSIGGENYRSDTTATYNLTESQLTELRTLLSSTDSLGDHHADGCVIQMGWPRFFIHAAIDGKELDGFITNCYREHVFKLVDFMNSCYPKGKIINYDKTELIEQEKRCNEYDYGRGEKK